MRDLFRHGRLAAAAPALENLTLGRLYVRKSPRQVAAHPLVWSVGMAAPAAFVAYGRYALEPPA